MRYKLISRRSLFIVGNLSWYTDPNYKINQVDTYIDLTKFDPINSSSFSSTSSFESSKVICWNQFYIEQLSSIRWAVWPLCYLPTSFREHPQGMILETCDLWNIGYNSDNWEPEFMTIFVNCQLRMTLDSIGNSCDVLLKEFRIRRGYYKKM